MSVYDEKLDNILKEMKVILTEDQMDAFNTAVHGDKHTLCVGRGGVGKSVLIDVIKRYLGDKVVVGSTTGISNQNLFDGKGGVGSMHKIFSLPINMHNDYHTKKASSFCSTVFSKHELTHIIIDEAGFLLNSDLLALIYKRIKRFNRKYRDRPQRDLKLILIGDLAQFPPFFSNDVKNYMQDLYGSEFFFKSNTFKEMDFNVVGINKVMRTDNKQFKAAQDVLRYAQKDRYEGVCKWINKVMYKPNIPAGIPSMVCTNKEAERLNMKSLEENPNKLWNYRAIIKDKYDIKNCPSGEVVSLKEGATVMTLINDQYGEYNNGSLGEVTMLTSDHVYIKMFHTGREVCITRHIFEETEMYQSGTKEVGDSIQPVMSNKIIGECHAFPLKLAYCLNVHKMQGKTVSSPMIVDLGKYGFNPNNSFGDAMAYVALSRFSNPEHVYLKYPLTPSHIKANREILDWLEENVGDKYKL